MRMVRNLTGALLGMLLFIVGTQAQPEPDAAVTRAEALLAVIQSAGLDADTPLPIRTGDPVARDEENQTLLRVAERMNMVPDKFGSLDDPITRAEMADLLVRGLENVKPDSVSTDSAASAPDVPAGSAHADSIRKVLSEGLMTSGPDGAFQPRQSVTRQNMEVMLSALKENAGLAEAPADSTKTPVSAPESPGDVPPWLYPAVVASLALVGVLIWLVSRGRRR